MKLILLLEESLTCCVLQALLAYAIMRKTRNACILQEGYGSLDLSSSMN